MSMISPAAWANVATTADLAATESRIEGRMDSRFDSLESSMDERIGSLETSTNERMDSRLAGLEDRPTAVFHQEMNRQIWTMIGSLIALSAVLTANNLW